MRIYQPAKTAMQSGNANTRKWVLAFEPGTAKNIDSLMGWVGSDDTRCQVHLKFGTKEEAVSFAERSGLAYRVHEPTQRPVGPKSYAANFRRGPASRPPPGIWDLAAHGLWYGWHLPRGRP